MPPFQNLAPFGSSRPTLVTALHSQVRQEAEYIQDRISAAECLDRKLTAEIAKAQAKLGEVRKTEGSRELAKSLKRIIRKKRSRLNRCVKNRQAFEARLATIFADMERMEQRQWRHSSPNLHNFGMSFTGDKLPSWTAHLSGPSAQTLNAPTLQTQYIQLPQPLNHSVSIHVPQTPVIRPTQSGFGHTPQEYYGVAEAGSGPGISPTDTVSPYELSSPKGLPVTYIPAAHQVHVLDAMNQMHISQPHESYVQTSSIPTTAIGQNIDLLQRPSMLDHQSAAFRLERAARKRKGQRSC
ncbi:uncharacterized protein PV07_01008 [Cladophialophora immunda]|uniref:Uncharacterized protein n=1 Tax=Cladophialophora immunda TaxID=569365 RepID=A0A0D2A1F2_9EURO|nr:uncharacterized protein PV07_01008 [Cladophialophora immunda]KIW34216.1 hypothetical protein PV07_01008 [Cladophialophora immunda]